MLRVVLWLAMTSIAITSLVAAQTANQERVSGNHRVRATSAGKRIELALKTGFSVVLRATAGSLAGQQVTLEIASPRAKSADVADGFVPIGPTVRLSEGRFIADVSFLAERFRVRQGHRLVLAVQSAGTCDGEPCRWQLLPATYEDMRCTARDVRAAGGRLQFGSVPTRP